MELTPDGLLSYIESTFTNIELRGIKKKFKHNLGCNRKYSAIQKLQHKLFIHIQLGIQLVIYTAESIMGWMILLKTCSSRFISGNN